jgi:hypothetical protein
MGPRKVEEPGAGVVPLFGGRGKLAGLNWRKKNIISDKGAEMNMREKNK